MMNFSTDFIAKAYAHTEKQYLILHTENSHNFSIRDGIVDFNINQI